MEKPVGSIAEPVLLLLEAITADANASSSKGRPAKRVKMTPSKGVKHEAESATGEPESTGVTKRVKMSQSSEVSPSSSSSTEIILSEAMENIMHKVEAILPRVGKKQFDTPKIISELNEMFPDMDIKRVVACKGTNRRCGPPNDVNPSQAPFRRSIMKLRDTLEIKMDPSWELYENLSHRQIIRSSPACRVNITMFAAAKNVAAPNQALSETPQPKAEEPFQAVTQR